MLKKIHNLGHVDYFYYELFFLSLNYLYGWYKFDNFNLN